MLREILIDAGVLAVAVGLPIAIAIRIRDYEVKHGRSHGWGVEYYPEGERDE